MSNQLPAQHGPPERLRLVDEQGAANRSKESDLGRGLALQLARENLAESYKKLGEVQSILAAVRVQLQRLEDAGK